MKTTLGVYQDFLNGHTTLTTLTHKLPIKYIKAYETCFINLVVYFDCEYNQCSDYMARALRRLRKV